jgi:hypothetical protein
MKITILAAVAALATAAALANDAGRSAPSTHRSRVVGVWISQVTLVNCATGAPIGVPEFAAINTFHDGGTLSEHGARFSPALRNNGQGTWRHTGWNRVASRFVFQRFDVNGIYIGTQEVSRKSVLSDDDQVLTSVADVRILAADGTLIATGCATETGRRF